MYDEQDYVCSITPKEFEVFCKEVLEGYAEAEHLNGFKIDHDVKLKAYDGTYQIDVYASFFALGVEFKVICECKQYSERVERKVVAELDAKVKSLGLHKGILLSTSGFQSGAIQYAEAHGIALLQVFDHSCEPYSFSGGPDAVPDEDDPFLYLHNHWPPYRAINCTAEEDTERCVYPTREIVEKLYAEQFRLMRQQGYNVKWPIDEGEQEGK